MTMDPTCRVAVNAPQNSPEPQTQPGILVVDDDRILLRLLSSVFARQGFAVWTAADGATAIDLYRRHQQAISVVLLDVCMPEMDGLQTLRELRRINPSVRACFMSGFTGKYVPEELRSAGGLFLVEKPFEVLPLAEQMWQLASGAA
jgi:CheY-like chemotaxis protein